MPANLTPQYLRAEEKYRQAQSPQARVECLERMLQLIPRHKGTDRLQGELRARLKELRRELAAGQKTSKTGRSIWIPRQGAGMVVIIGGPNAGKSRLLKELTGASPEVAPYPFTTRVPQAGMMAWEDLQVQLIDTPPFTPGVVENTTLSFIRSADLVVLCMDGSEDDAISITARLIEDLTLRKTCLSTVNGFDSDDFSIVHVKTFCVVTRADEAETSLRLELLQQSVSLPFPARLVELERPEEISQLRRHIGNALPIIRVYPRRPGEAHPDPSPITLPIGATVVDLAEEIHLELAARVKFAKVFRESSLSGKTVQRDHLLCDRDVVELY